MDPAAPAPDPDRELSCRRVRVFGRVQGVGFREACRREAERLGVAGWVRNCRDGSVEALLQGSDEALARMLGWLRRGPPAARVERIEVSEAEAPSPPLQGFARRPGE